MVRYLADPITDDLPKKMVFVGGPRQVGKTTLAKTLIKSKAAYLNWDIASDREKILKTKLPNEPFIIFDEIHKYRKWRNYLKGLYDGREKGHSFLVTGSARLDFYRFGGDSLQGRFYYYRMHPLSFAELKMATKEDLNSLLNLGGFPEPFFSGKEKVSRRWSQDYRSRLIRDEVTSLEQVKDLGQLELLALTLPDRVGSPLSINSLQTDIQISPKTIAKWVQIFERLYFIFRIAPFGPPKVKAVKKEQKHYHFDWTTVTDPGARFENLVACHLLKWVDFERDTSGRNLELRYYRDDSDREVDFVILEDRKPVRFVEVKLSDAEVARGLRYLKSRFPDVESWQISATGRENYRSKDGIRVAPAIELLRTLV